MSDVWRNLKREEKRIETERSHEGRVEVRHVVNTDGIGRFNVSDPLYFGVGYRQKPDLRVLSEAVDWGKEGQPLVTVSVREWIQDENGYYIGAYIGLAVL